MAATTALRCATCRREPDELHALQEAGHGASAPALHLCASCLAEREARVWPRSSDDGRRLSRALDERSAAPGQRFTYFYGDDEAIHLVRLRPAWVERHAAHA